MSNFLDKPAITAVPNTGAASPRPALTKPAGPVNHPGLKQADGNQSGLGFKPTRASLQDRTSSSGEARSGMESAMGALADKEHPRRFKGRR